MDEKRKMTRKIFFGIGLFQLAVVATVSYMDCNATWLTAWFWCTTINLLFVLVVVFGAYQNIIAEPYRLFRRQILPSGLVLLLIAYDVLAIRGVMSPARDFPTLMEQVFIIVVYGLPCIAGLLIITAGADYVYAKML